MDRLTYIFAAVVLITTLLAIVAIRSRRPVAPKVVALVLAAMLMPTAYLALVDLLGRPKPAQMEWFRAAAADAQVIGSRIREGEAIYLWLEFKDVDEPWSYRLPWNLDLAKQLHDASRQARASGRKVHMRWIGQEENAQPQDPTFYPEPQRALPLKVQDERDGETVATPFQR